MKRPVIVLQNCDGSHNRYITSRERDFLLNSTPPQAEKPGRKRIKPQKGVPTREVYRLFPEIVPLRDMHQASPPSITSREMRINAGIEGTKAQRIIVREKVKAHGRTIVCGLLVV